MTNDEKIRKMDDYELANVLQCPNEYENDLCINPHSGCIECITEWLSMEAKNDG